MNADWTLDGEILDTIVQATQGICPVCDWTTLNLHALGAIAAAADHTRSEHPTVAADRYFYPEDAWQRIPTDWQFATVTAITTPTAGQLALFTGH